MGVWPGRGAGQQQSGRVLPVQRSDTAQLEPGGYSTGDTDLADSAVRHPHHPWRNRLCVCHFRWRRLDSPDQPLEMRERVTMGMGLDGGEKILQLLVVRMLLILPNLLVAILAVALVWGQVSRIDLTSPTNPLSGLFGGFFGIMLIAFLVNLLTSALSVGAERAIVIEKMPIGKALGLSWQLLATQLGDFIMIGLIFLGLSILVGVLFSCVGQPLLALMFSTASPAAMVSGSC